MTKPLIKLEQVDVALNGQTILRGLRWQLRPGQHWAILGGNGSGKSTLLKLIRGDLWPMPGRGERMYSFDGGEQTSAVGIKEKIGLVSPELHERYLRQAWVLTAWQVIQTGIFNTDYLYQKPTPRQRTMAAAISRLLGVEGLLARNVQQLSTGELRKILIARALAGEPRVLIFDEVCDGLDAPSRAHLLQTIERVARAGTQIIYTTHRAEEVIPAITHELVLKQGRIVSCGEKNGQAAARGEESGSSRRESAHYSPRKDQSRLTSAAAGHSANPRQRGMAPAPLLVSIRRAHVFLGRKKVLHGIDWVMHADENWAVLGPNGAGKSTFLKLVFGDLHPAAGARIRWFDLPANHTVWELKQRIGYVSPEFQANYLDESTGEEVIASGFFSSVGLRDRLTSPKRTKVRQLLRSFRLEPLGSKLLSQMSYGEVRAVLTLRALANDPALLILDEPFDGLDAEAKKIFAQALERVSERGTRLIIVTHHAGDLPTCITHGLLLEKGHIMAQGELNLVRPRYFKP